MSRKQDKDIVKQTTMRIRTKLLIILLAISVIPLSLLGVVRVRNALELGRDLTARQGTALIEQARRLMSVIAEDHARTLHRERQLLEAALKYQVLAARARLLGPVPVDPDPVLFNIDLSQKKDTLRLRKLRARCAWLGLPTTKEIETECVDKQVFQLAPGLTTTIARKDVARLADMDDVYRDLTEGLKDLVSWQAIGLESGLLSIYPGHDQFPPDFDARQTTWYIRALGNSGVVWSPPYLDGASGEILLTASLAIRDGKGVPLGASSVMAPLNVLLQQNEHTRHLSKNIDAMFLRAETTHEADSRWRIIAQRQPAGHEHAVAQGSETGWKGASGALWLTLDDPGVREYFRAQLRNGEGGVFQAPHRGIPSLWVFAPVPGDEGVLVFTAPVEDVLRDARAAMDHVALLMREQIIQSVFILGMTIIMVTGLSVVIARRFTVPLQRLSLAARRLSMGDYKATVEIHGRDELAELGKIFNEMGPRIDENLQFREGAMLAMQVQQNLLPDRCPDIPGLDAAGVSIYCDDTGGDYYDFFLREAAAGKRCLAVSIGDVSGHGMEAALLMTTARAFLRMRAHLPGCPSEIISGVNRFLSMDTEGTGRFMSLFYLEIELPDKAMTWVRAGHDAALLYDPVRDVFSELGGPGLTLGVAQDWNYVQSATRQFGNGEVVVLGSDGIWETRDPQGRLFGKERLKEVIRKSARGSAREMIDVVLEALDRFREGTRPDDDVTLVVVKNRI